MWRKFLEIVENILLKKQRKYKNIENWILIENKRYFINYFYINKLNKSNNVDRINL